MLLLFPPSVVTVIAWLSLSGLVTVVVAAVTVTANDGRSGGGGGAGFLDDLLWTGLETSGLLVEEFQRKKG